MKTHRRKRRGGKKKKSGDRTRLLFLFLLGILLAVGVGVTVLIVWMRSRSAVKPEDLLAEYMGYIEEGAYESMYAMLDAESRERMTKEDFVERNRKIYEGVEARNLTVNVTEKEEPDKNTVILAYHTEMETLAGSIAFDHEAVFHKDKEKGYALFWYDNMIFPNLTDTDRIKVTTEPAKRGQVLDRDGLLLAGMVTASSVGLVPGKMNEDAAADIARLAELLRITPESIEKSLSAGWVKSDSFVPLKNIEKIQEVELLSSAIPSERTQAKLELQEALLAIPGVMITDTQVRGYPLGEAASHLTGYVQNVTAEDLEKHKGEGYNANSVIGRSGMETLFEEQLRGEDGHEIRIVDQDGGIKETLASTPVMDGKDVRLTIDSGLQNALYTRFLEDKSCSVAMDPYTGEVLALVSTPSYNANDFIFGMSGEKWEELNNDESKPLYNRYRQTWCPGSSFKPVVASVGLTSGSLDPAADFGNEGLSWQKDESWGNYYVTTLHSYEPVILENALIYSDNIYFAKAALEIGAESLTEGLDRLGFGQQLPFEINMQQSQYANEDTIQGEIQLADSGYGQGQILVNPLHLASIYTAFLNGGNIVKPRLTYETNAKGEFWIENAFSQEASDFVKEALVKVVNDPHGTGYKARREDILLGGKTGTAEIKLSKDDKSGTELGWFGVFTADPETEKPILIMTMVEDVKDRGGSGYVVGKINSVLEFYLPQENGG